MGVAWDAPPSGGGTDAFCNDNPAEVSELKRKRVPALTNRY